MNKIKYLVLLLIIPLFLVSSCGNKKGKIILKNEIEKLSVGASYKLQLDVEMENKRINKEDVLKDLIITSLNDDIIKVEEDTLIALKEGKATINVVGKKYNQLVLNIEIEVFEDKIKKITYVTNGGTFTSEVLEEYEEGKVYDLPTIEKTNYEFLGWYLDSEFKKPINRITKATKGDITLYALWEKRTMFYIDYIYDEGFLPTHFAETFEEFSESFWWDFYSWCKDTGKKPGSITNFKSNVLASWKQGLSGGFNYYKEDGKDFYSEDYFLNDRKNYQKYINWFDNFDKVVNEINHEQTAWSSTMVGYIRLYNLFTKGASYWTSERIKKVYSLYPVTSKLPSEYNVGDKLEIVNLVIDDGRRFLGWFDQNGNLVDKITPDMEGDLKLTAKWSETIPATSLKITNEISKIKLFTTYQLEWEILPSDSTQIKLSFESSDKSICSVDNYGCLTANKMGTAEITIRILGNDELSIKLNIEVYVDEFIDGKYINGTSVEIDNEIKLEAKIIGSTNGVIKWKSKNEDIASVSSDGVVKGKKAGYVEIIAYDENNENVNLSFGITIISLEDSPLFSIFSKYHNKEIFVTENLNVGYTYLTDIYGSVSKILFEDFVVDRTYEKVQAANSSNHGGKIDEIEFITVHYTAGMASSATAASTCDFMCNSSTVSIHYITGNDGIYHCLDNSLIACHAGDGTSIKFTWYNTGVKATENKKPVWGVVKDQASKTGYYFTINGVKTTCQEVPIEGLTSRGTTKTLTNPADSFTFFGPAWKIVDGMYYMGNTWACFTQVYNGAISSKGGNRNSIGIETACNKGSDLWLTYQRTAQLVARLLDNYKLDLTRVVGHNMFSGKDCPQTLLANNGELWYKFMECTEAELELYQNLLKDGNYTISVKSNDPDILDDNGRIKFIPLETRNVSYTISITNKATNETRQATFATMIKGKYVQE